MKKITFLFLVFVGLLFSSCQQEMISDVNSENDLFKADKNQKKLEIPVNFNILFNSSDSQGCTDPVIMPLTAGQNIDVGTLELSSDDTYLYVTYNVNKTYAGEASEWYLAETHLFVGCDASEIPMNGGGNPVIGHFPYSENHAPEKSVTYTIYLTDFDCDDECLIISAHATVITLDSNSQQDQDETAFGGCDDDSSEFAGSRWGCWFSFCPQDCPTQAWLYKEGSTGRVKCFEQTEADGDVVYGFSNKFQHIYGGTYPVYTNVGEDCDLSEKSKVGTVRIVLFDYGLSTERVKIKFIGEGDYADAKGVMSIWIGWPDPVDNGSFVGDNSGLFQADVIDGVSIKEIYVSSWPGVLGDGGIGSNGIAQYFVVSNFALEK